MTMKQLLLAAMLIAGCKGEQKSCSVSALGAWPNNPTVDVTCGNDKNQLVCQPPASGAKTTDCTCNANGVVGKKATVELTPGGMLLGDTAGVVKTACGWQ